MRLAFIFILFYTQTFAQPPTGTIRFLIEQDNGYFEILVNDTLVLRTYRDTLPIGTYTAKIWSPGFAIVDTSFVIKENIETICFHVLRRSQEYVMNSKINVQRDKKRTLLFKLPLAVSLASYANVGFQTSRIIKEADSLDNFALLYRNLRSLSSVQTYRSELIKMEREFQKVRFMFYGGIALSVVATTFTIYGHRILNKRYPGVPLINKLSPFTNKLTFNWGYNSLSICLKI